MWSKLNYENKNELKFVSDMLTFYLVLQDKDTKLLHPYSKIAIKTEDKFNF